MKTLINISIIVLTFSFSGFCQVNAKIDSISVLYLDSLNYFPYDTLTINGFNEEVDKIIRFNTLNEINT